MTAKTIALALSAGILALPAFAGTSDTATMATSTTQPATTAASSMPAASGQTKMAAAASTQASPGMTAPDAQKHFADIAGGNIGSIMSQYASDAQLQWVGGPLNGSYEGRTQIRRVWENYLKAMGKGSEKASDIKVFGDAKGMTVTADVDFGGKHSVPVRMVLVYRDKKLVSEVWQVAGTKMG